MRTYSNPWHDPEKPEYGQETFVTDAEAESCRGFEIFNRTAEVWDVVKGGFCVGQFAGPDGARRGVDAYLDGKDHYLTMPETPSVPGL